MEINKIKELIIESYNRNKGLPNGSSKVNGGNAKILYEPVFSNISQILTNSSFLFYEFEDKEVEYNYDEGYPELGKYTRDISPLFLKNVVESESNNELLNIIDEEVPLYHIQPEHSAQLDAEDLSDTRDCGVNNVHSALQDSSFYQVWLRDVFGSIQNQLLLNSYNKMRWPVVGENQYIMADLFPSLAMSAFRQEGTEDTSTLIEFRETAAENIEDNNFYETIDGIESSLHTKVGCVDYLNEIVEKKLSSVYDILDYHPGRRDVITAWGESLHESAQVTSEDLEKQLIIYKLQDVKYELLKRKYAGTKTLYNLTLNALDRQGSFISAVPLSSAKKTSASDLYFVDKRLIRILNIPGVTVDSEDTSYYPLNYLAGRDNSPSINDIASLYYSSGMGYNAENFYTEKYSQLGDTSALTVGTVGDLRKNIKYLNWNCLLGMSKGQTASSVYSKLDTYIIDTEYTGEQFSKLDSKDPVDGEGEPLIKNSETGAAKWSFLDYAEDSVNISNNTSVKDIIDLSANRILYNSNVLQQKEGESYPYVTYRIAGGNSISLMDTSWMEYIQTSIEEKSRVQEDIEYGAQLNKYQELSAKRLGRYSFFAISYDTNGEVKEAEIVWQSLRPYSEEVSFAYLWYCTVEYEVDTFTIQNFDKKIISRIVLKIDTEDDSYSDVEEYQELKTFSKGILPFTYFGVSDDTLLSKLYNGKDWDLLTEAGYSKAYYVFSDEDLLQITIPEGNISFTEFTSLLNQYEKHISSSPSANTKTVFYVAKKGEDEYAWSSPIRVFNLKSLKFEAGDVFYPDWYDECYFLNPYLNFTKNSASPLRNKRVYSTQQAHENYGLDEVVKTVSNNIYLSNLVRFRGKDFLCCDNGEEISKWVDLLVNNNPIILTNFRGFYLDRVEPVEKADEGKCALTIYGDPRTLNIYDEALSNDLTMRITHRGEVYSDTSTGIKCLSFESKLDSSITNSEGYQFEYLKLVPGGVSSNSEEAYEKWWWNLEKNGIFIAMNIALIPENLKDGIYSDPVLLKRKGEFCLSLEYTEDTEAKLVFEYGGERIESDYFTISNNNIRLGAGTTPDKKLLIVVDGNTKIGDKEISSINTSSSEEPIYLGINVTEDSYSNCFLGKLYDLRLYNRGFAEKNAILLTGGSFRELYSYSPDLYILGYNNYVDLGIFKEVSSRIGVDGDTALIDEVTALRAFNRSVWDSIMIDRCPITADELDTNRPFYRKDVSDSQEDTDVYGWVNGDKTLKDCVEIDLESFESLNNASLRNSTGEKMNVKYNGGSIEVDESDHTTAVTTMIYPVVYNKDSMIDSNSILFEKYADGTMKTVKVEESSEPAGLLLPQAFTSTDGNIKYEADFSLNFTINPTSNFTNYYSKGSNISLQYNNLLQEPVIVRNNNSDSSSAANHVLIPLTVPRQQDLSIENVGYFDRLNLSNVELNNSLNTLLKATSYYNELRIPVAMDVTTDSKDTRGSVYASKWDAIRTLKEGTYYITCKYPFQILPFADNLYDTANKAKYNYLYATVRFKVEVSGTPIVYENGKNGAEDITASYKEKYNRENIISTLKSTAALFDPLDNRTFPHRRINIDLYVQDCSNTSVVGRMQANSDGSASESYSFYWKLLGTNHPDDYKASEDWILLTKQTLESSLVITTEIPAFFSKNMTSPFFIAKSEKTSSGTRVNSASADDDLIDPIRINPIYNSVKLTSYVKASGVATAGTSYYVKNGSSYYLADPQPEVLTDVSANYYTKIESLDNLQVQSENDLDNLVLVAGRAYKVLWDYTGYVSEFSFTDKLYSQTAEAIASLSGDTPKYEMVDSEKTNYARLSSLLDLENISDYSYNENGTGYNIYDTQLSGKTNGYHVSSGEYIECYRYVKETDETLDSNFIRGWLTSPRAIVIGDNSYVCNANAMLSSYTLKIASSESDVPSAEDIPIGVIYRVEGTEKYYTAEGSVTVKTVSSLTESVWDTLEIGSYYKNSNSDSIYRMGVQLENVIFKDGDIYKVWNYYGLATVSVDTSTYKGINYCPAETDAGKIYPSTTDGIYYRYVDSDAPHFTEISAVADSSEYSSAPFYFGNPYSRSSEGNYLLKIRDASSSYSRANITNSWYFPYTPTEVPENQFLSAGLLTSSTPLEVKVSDYGDISQIALDEKDILSKQHDSIWTSIKTAISSLINGNDTGSQNMASGIFTALSSIEPNYYYGASAMAQNATYVRTFSDDLISYLASDRTYPSKNENILVTRRGLYSNNLIKNQDLDNASYWTWGNASNLLGEGNTSSYNLYSKEYVSDSDWDEGLGKDVCEVTYKSFGDGGENNSSNPLTVKYANGATSIGAVYEVALNIRVSSQTYDNGVWNSTSPKFYAWVETSAEETDSTLTLTDVTNNVEYRDYYPETGTNLIVVKKSSLEAKGYLGTDVSGESLTLKQWENKGELVLGSTQTVSSSERNSLLKELYVDSQANDVTVYTTFLSNGTRVGSPLRLYVTSLSQQNESVSGLAAFDDQWYTISAEPSSIVTADSIAFEFVCKKPVKFRLTKVVVRKSDSKTHALGLADGLYTKKTSSNNASVIVSSHHCIAYRNKTTKEMIPVQFNATVSKRASSSSYTSASINYALSGLTNIEDFRTNYSLGYEASNQRVEKLMDPWKRRFYYSRSISSDIQEVYFKAETGEIYEEYYNTNTGEGYQFERKITPAEGTYYYFLNGSNEEKFIKNNAAGEDEYIITAAENGNYYVYRDGEFSSESVPFIEKTYFHKYEVKKGSTGVKEESENKLSVKDLYLPIEDSVAMYDTGSASRGVISIRNLKLNTSSGSVLNKYSTNLIVTEDSSSTSKNKVIKAGPITVSNIKVSALANCFDYEKYRSNEENILAVTNIQLLGERDSNDRNRILFEIEYPPVILKEGEQHLSCNILLHKKASAATETEETS